MLLRANEARVLTAGNTGLDVDAGDIIGRGLRETVAEERDIALLETLLSAQER